MLDEPVPASATFAAGEQEAEFRVPTVDDDANEADSAVTAALRKGSGHRLGVNETQEATRTVLDDDAAPGPGATPASAGVTVWEADMTVVDYENGSIGAGSADLLANQRGSAGLQVKNLWYYAPDRKLHMALTTADAERLTLHAGNVSAVLQGGSPKHSWNDVDVDWTDGQTFVARLVRGETAGSPAPDATLNSLGVSDAVLSPGFDPDVVLYTALIDAGTASVTLSAVANDDEGRVAFGPSEDADVEQPGHQVAVPYGESLMTVTVTAANGETKRAYRVVAMRPHPTVSLRSASYTATEGGDAASVVVELSADPGQDVTIPLTAAPAGGADAADYTVPESVTFISGGALSQTVEVTAVSDDATEDGESVVLGFGTLPDGIAASGTTSATVSLVDAAAAVENTPAGDALTAAFQEVPVAHGGPGSEPFTFRVLFSEEIPVSYRVLRDQGTFTVVNGMVKKARRVDGRNDLREIHIQPSGWDAVSVTLPATTSCAATGAICMGDERMLSNTETATVEGPVAIDVADAKVTEGPGATLDFVVSLSRAANATVTVDYATADGTATEGDDYTRTSGTLTFEAGQTEKTVAVPVLDDAHDDDGETMTLVLSNAVGARIRDGEAVGTIENSDAIPKAWLARFGRTVADHVVDAVGARIEGRTILLRRASPSVAMKRSSTPSGRRPERSQPPGRRRETQGRRLSGGRLGRWGEKDDSPAREVTMGELLLGSSFHLASAQ